MKARLVDKRLPTSQSGQLRSPAPGSVTDITGTTQFPSRAPLKGPRATKYPQAQPQLLPGREAHDPQQRRVCV